MVTFILTLLAALTPYEIIVPGQFTAYSATYARCGMWTCGKQKKMYLGRTDDPEGELARKRTASEGESP
jgi:hypothetical protein